jgi:catechol 2,3-dioxygenase-like lactoylglutathione lyase family enzyme
MMFDHVAMQVPNIAEAVDWYHDTIPGSRVLYQDDTWAFLEAGGTKLAFVLPHQHAGHIAWRVDDAHLEALAARYGKSIKPHRDGTRSFYLEGPGGHAVEIISYPPGQPSC